ncbi:hypothetical protein BS47DRAFT_1298557 [Hydnum rufescens UP504]|uniref:Alpha-type protein kinase domain-containing protein n=1 Tax=Hydnum rufescens UP504 TaxID=1448309 RepID=A0A9P6DUK6_9AGAM|nr:hypothetical protein BS47DRAFT_1298557 [Hydnum rufescens UP504]
MIGYPGFRFNTEGMFLGEIVNDTIPYVGSGLDDAPILLYRNFIATQFLPHNRLEKGFVKYTGNDGSVDPDLKFTALGRTLDAFQHYCIAVSKESFMVCDLQGHRLDKEVFYLFDPQANSNTSKKFGYWDLGPNAIKAYLNQHKCNSLCRAIGIN